MHIYTMHYLHLDERKAIYRTDHGFGQTNSLNRAAPHTGQSQQQQKDGWQAKKHLTGNGHNETDMGLFQQTKRINYSWASRPIREPAAFTIALAPTDASAGSFTGPRSIGSSTASVTTRFASASGIESASNASYKAVRFEQREMPYWT